METCNERSALIKGLDALAVEMKNLSSRMTDTPGWEKIETAPKDGRSVLAYADGKITTVRWIKESPDTEAYWSLCVPGTFTLHHFWEPTHWLPLPPGPEDV